MVYLILNWLNHLPKNLVLEPVLGVNIDWCPTLFCLVVLVVVLATVEKAAAAARIRDALNKKERLVRVRETGSLSSLWFMILSTF